MPPREQRSILHIFYEPNYLKRSTFFSLLKLIKFPSLNIHKMTKAVRNTYRKQILFTLSRTTTTTTWVNKGTLGWNRIKQIFDAMKLFAQVVASTGPHTSVHRSRCPQFVRLPFGNFKQGQRDDIVTDTSRRWLCSIKWPDPRQRHLPSFVTLLVTPSSCYVQTNFIYLPATTSAKYGRPLFKWNSESLYWIKVKLMTIEWTHHHVVLRRIEPFQVTGQCCWYNQAQICNLFFLPFNFYRAVK